MSFRISAEESPSDVMAGLWEPQAYVSAYAEVGLGRSLTLGADIGQGDVNRMAVGFLRYTFTPGDAVWQIAADIGLGARQTGEDDPHGLVRFGASIGRGFGSGGDAWYMPLRHDGGWLTLDMTALYDVELDDAILQAEGIAGLSLSDQWAVTFSIKAEDWPGSDLLVTFSPSVIYDFNASTSLRVAARGPVTGTEAIGLSVEIWQNF